MSEVKYEIWFHLDSVGVAKTISSVLLVPSFCSIIRNMLPIFILRGGTVIWWFKMDHILQIFPNVYSFTNYLYQTSLKFVPGERGGGGGAISANNYHWYSWCLGKKHKPLPEPMGNWATIVYLQALMCLHYLMPQLYEYTLIWANLATWKLPWFLYHTELHNTMMYVHTLM